eukprot:gene19417-12066_t
MPDVLVALRATSSVRIPAELRNQRKRAGAARTSTIACAPTPTDAGVRAQWAAASAADELRVDSDGSPYTWQEFCAEYGDEAGEQWDGAAPLPHEQHIRLLRKQWCVIGPSCDDVTAACNHLIKASGRGQLAGGDERNDCVRCIKGLVAWVRSDEEELFGEPGKDTASARNIAADRLRAAADLMRKSWDRLVAFNWDEVQLRLLVTPGTLVDLHSLSFALRQKWMAGQVGIVVGPTGEDSDVPKIMIDWGQEYGGMKAFPIMNLRVHMPTLEAE